MSKTLPFVLMLSTLASAIELNISIPSFPEISSYFNISDGITGLTISINLIGYCIACIFVGPLSETYGRRLVMIVGGTIMLVGATGCAFAPSIEFLLFSRFIQGVGASTPTVIVFAIIADLYSGAKSAKLIGQVAALLTICSSVAPIVGGYIHQLLGWRGNYAFVALVSSISLLFVIAKLPETKKSFDKLDAGQIARNYWLILTDDFFICAACIPVICYAGFISFIVYAPFLYTKTFNLPMMNYTLHQGAIILSFSISSMYVGVFIRWFGIKNSTVWGAGACLAATIFILFLSLYEANTTITVYGTTVAMMIFAAGCASCRAVSLAQAMEIHLNIKGQASAVIAGLRMLIAAVAISLTGYFQDGSLFVIAVVILISAIIMMMLNFRFLKQSSLYMNIN